MNIEMLYSTHEKRIYELINKIPKPNKKLGILIIHQTKSSRLSGEIRMLLSDRSDIRYIPTDTSGVSISRNIALKEACGDILIFCDDDVVYDENFMSILYDAYTNNSNADCITFPIQALGESGYTKNYSSSTFTHNMFSILKVGTIEVTIRRNSLIGRNIYFPENLGAGSRLPLCDEPVFLAKLLKSKLNLCYVPTAFASHPKESSGQKIGSINELCSRLVAFKMMYGNFFGVIVYIVFIIKNINKIESKWWLINSFFTRG